LGFKQSEKLGADSLFINANPQSTTRMQFFTAPIFSYFTHHNIVSWLQLAGSVLLTATLMPPMSKALGTDNPATLKDARRAISSNITYYTDRHVTYQAELRALDIVITVKSNTGPGRYEVAVPYANVKYYEMEDDGKIILHVKDKKQMKQRIFNSEGIDFEPYIWSEIYLYMRSGADLASLAAALDHIIDTHK